MDEQLETILNSLARPESAAEIHGSVTGRSGRAVVHGCSGRSWTHGSVATYRAQAVIECGVLAN